MTSQVEPERPVPPFFRGAANRPEVIAHRGGAGQWPGETVFAFERALEVGADVLEMDVHGTRDGHLVLMHNKTLDRTTNGSGRIKERDWDYIKTLDAGYRWTADGHSYPFRTRPGGEVPEELRVPRLDDVLGRLKDRRPPARLIIEIKQTSPSIAARLDALIREHGMADRVLVASGRGSALREFRGLQPGRGGGAVPTSASVFELLKFRTLNHILGLKPRGLAYEALELASTAFVLDSLLPLVRLPFITRGYLQTAHGEPFRLPVHGWTVNHPADMERLIHLQVDGIMTDYPSALLALLGR
jgi:glycerophosphoryl diester phosphodiesterase